MTAVSSVQENWDGTHHGVKLEVIQSFPGGRAATTHPWRGALDHKKAQVQFGKTFAIIAIARDRGCECTTVELRFCVPFGLTPHLSSWVNLCRR